MKKIQISIENCYYEVPQGNSTKSTWSHFIVFDPISLLVTTRSLYDDQITHKTALYQGQILLGEIPNGCADTTGIRLYLESRTAQDKLHAIVDGSNVVCGGSKKTVLLSTTSEEILEGLRESISTEVSDASDFWDAAEYLGNLSPDELGIGLDTNDDQIHAIIIREIADARINRVNLCYEDVRVYLTELRDEIKLETADFLDWGITPECGGYSRSLDFK